MLPLRDLILRGRSRPRSVGQAAILAACAALLAAAPALGRALTLTAEPATPNWHETVSLVVVGTGCAPSLSTPRLDVDTATIEVDLQDICNIVSPAIQAPFRLTVELPPLQPRLYALRVLDVENGGAATESSLQVYNVTNLALEVSENPTNAAAPRIAIGNLFRCLFLLDVAVDGPVIAIDFAGGSECPFFPPLPDSSLNFLSFDLFAPLAPGDYEVRLFDRSQSGALGVPGVVRRPIRVWDANGCLPSPTRLCLREGRFAVDVTWRDFDGQTGASHSKPLPGNDGSGLVWFFTPDNVELTLKVLDGCGLNHHWWAFISSSSTVEYTITVTDTRTHKQRVYSHPAGGIPALISDTEAFQCP